MEFAFFSKLSKQTVSLLEKHFTLFRLHSIFKLFLDFDLGICANFYEDDDFLFTHSVGMFFLSVHSIFEVFVCVFLMITFFLSMIRSNEITIYYFVCCAVLILGFFY